MVTIVPSPVEYHRKPETECVKIASEIIRSWEKSGSTLLACFEPNFGTFTMALPWGGKIIGGGDTYQHIQAVSDNIDEILDIELSDNPHIERAVRTYRDVCENTGNNNIRFMTPDFQGVLNTAAMIMDQSALMMAMITAPDKVHQFLDKVYDANITFFKQLLSSIGHIDGNFWPPIWLPHTVGVMVIEDMMPMLSPDLYKEFGLPYLKRFSDEFGGVFFHICGRWSHHMKNLAESGINILGFEYHHPHATLDQINEYFDDVVVVPFLDGYIDTEYPDVLSFTKALLAKRKKSISLWFAGYDDLNWPVEEIQALIESG